MELQNDASACSKCLPAALRERRVGEHRQRLALPEYGRMGVALHQMKAFGGLAPEEYRM